MKKTVAQTEVVASFVTPKDWQNVFLVFAAGWHSVPLF
jgi:hypothetical protein